MKLLVIGKHGQLARSFAERAANAAGFELMAAGRPEIDLSQPGSAAAAIARSGAAAVVNAAAYTAVDAAESDAEAILVSVKRQVCNYYSAVAYHLVRGPLLPVIIAAAEEYVRGDDELTAVRVRELVIAAQ